jgi:hypothetical protein
MANAPKCTVCTATPTARYRWKTLNRGLDHVEVGDLCEVCALAVGHLASTTAFEQVGPSEPEPSD